MILPNQWAALEWALPVSILVVVAAIVTFIGYRKAPGQIGLRLPLAAIKILAIALLALCLLEPVIQFTRPEPGANLLMVLADDSQSLQIKDANATSSRSDAIDNRLNQDNRWLNQLSELFDVRRYQFDQSLRPVANFSQFQADRRGSNLLGNLGLVSKRFSGRPAAGIVVLTDGNDSLLDQYSRLNQQGVEPLNRVLSSIDWESMPPVYPVVVGAEQPAADIGITRVSYTQTNFETAPVTLNVGMIAHGFPGEKLAIQLLDETGELVEQKEVADIEDGREFVVRFQSSPRKQGVNVFQIRAMPASVRADQQTEQSTAEATLVNNRQLVAVNRGKGPYRILYVCGRPNWELKFLQRAMQDDPEINLVSLIRIATKEAKFAFRGRDGQQSNSLFRGFETQDDDTTEQHDEPVFLRIGTKDESELRGGFPKDPESLFKYDAIILDDIEADFFSEDQKALLLQFVAFRGGGLLMMGGQESFAGGGFDRTPIGEMLPVYLDRFSPSDRDENYRLELTRDGWLQPWVRIESTEAEERKRLQQMPGFRTINRTDSIKPGATVMATVSSEIRREVPALVVQPFGDGRVAAMLIGDFWRWHMRSDGQDEDMYKAWRQMARWLVADVPRRVELNVTREGSSATTNRIEVKVSNESFRPEDNAKIELTVTPPEGPDISISTTPATDKAGVYESTFTSTKPGVYKATATVTAEDGSPIETREYGWVCEPDREEFRSLVPDRSLLQEIADRTDGELLELNRIDELPQLLESKPVPISQKRSLPWWHRWSVLGIALGLLVGEWGLRRWKGLP